MVSGIWGKKIGMTQLFKGEQVIPVTAIDVGNWVVTGIKTEERDGYNAVQVGCPRKRFANQKPTADWVKKPQHYFSQIREIRVKDIPENLAIGQSANFTTHLEEGENVNVFGTSKGRGFTGVVKRWDFAGPPATHGSTMGNRTGAIGFMTSEGKVVKGKKMPGRYGGDRLAVKNLDVVKIAEDAPVIFVKGAVPGHAGSLVFLQRQEK